MVHATTSLDCNKIHSNSVVRKELWELPDDSHTIAVQWVHMVKDPPVTILHVHMVVASKYTTLMLLH